MNAQEIYEAADKLAVDMVKESCDHPSLMPFLVVMERTDFVSMMDSPDAPRLVRRSEFSYPSSGWEICGLPIRVEPVGSWKGKVIKPYPLVMTQLQAQMCFGGEYG